MTDSASKFTKFDFIDVDALEAALSERFHELTMKSVVSPREFLQSGQAQGFSFCQRLSNGSILAVIYSHADDGWQEASICKIPAGEMYSRASKSIQSLASCKYRSSSLENTRNARDICHRAVGAH